MAPPVASAEMMTRLFSALGPRPVETCVILYLGPHWRLLGMRHAGGNVGSVDLSIRTIAADALAFEASTMVMAHNHPSGDPEPSHGDIGFTRDLVRAMDPLGVRLCDHLVVTTAAVTSMRARQLF